MAFEAFAFARPLILKVFVAEFHPLQTGFRLIAKLYQMKEEQHSMEPNNLAGQKALYARELRFIAF